MKDQAINVDSLLYQQKQLTKNQIRIRRIIQFLILMGAFVGGELGINGICLATKQKLPFLIIDCIMYFGVFIMCCIEIWIQKQKMVKKCRKQIRLRVEKCQLHIYLLFLMIIMCLTLYHILVQVYFFSQKFDQECFYLEYCLDVTTFKYMKSFIFALFIVFEIIIIIFLLWILKEIDKALRFPQKFRISSIQFRCQTNDIVLHVQQQ